MIDHDGISGQIIKLALCIKTGLIIMKHSLAIAILALLPSSGFTASNYVCLFGGDPGCSLKGYVYWSGVDCHRGNGNQCIGSIIGTDQRFEAYVPGSCLGWSLADESSLVLDSGGWGARVEFCHNIEILGWHVFDNCQVRTLGCCTPITCG